MQTTASGLQYIDTIVGDGAEAAAGASVQVHYTGWLYNDTSVDKKGAKFDSSKDRGDPFAFDLGAGSVIKGWDEGWYWLLSYYFPITMIHPTGGQELRLMGIVVIAISATILAALTVLQK